MWENYASGFDLSYSVEEPASRHLKLCDKNPARGQSGFLEIPSWDYDS